MREVLGGTANVAILGGNLPPSPYAWQPYPFSGSFGRSTGGRVARPNGPVASPTPHSIESFRRRP
jgi:hypothetical protein